PHPHAPPSPPDALPILRRTSRRTQDRQAELNQILQETLSGHMVVKAFTAEEYESRRFHETSQRLLHNNARYVLQQGLSSPVIDLDRKSTRQNSSNERTS